MDTPISLFKNYWQEAIDINLKNMDMMLLTTLRFNGYPASRIVLLKDIDEGLVFYTNYQSQKGLDITNNPHASIHFFWRDLNYFITLDGVIQKTSREMSEKYFRSRPYLAKISALASQQSQPIPYAETIYDKIKLLELSYPDDAEVPCPEHWGGYRLVPNHICVTSFKDENT